MLLRGKRFFGGALTYVAMGLAGATVTMADIPAASAATDRVIAVFVTPKGKVDAAWLEAFRAQLVEHPAALPSGQLLFGDALGQALGMSTEAASQECGPNITCLAGLGKKAQARTVLYTRLVAAAGGITVQCLIIDVATASIADKTAFDIKTFDSVATLVGANLAQMFPDAAKPKPENTAAKKPAVESPADSPIVFDWDGSTPAAAPAPTPAPAPEIADASAPVDASGAPRKYTRAELFQEFAVEDGHADRAQAALDSGQRLDGTVPAPAEPIFGPEAFMHAWRYTGIGLTGVGVVGIGLGAMFSERTMARSANNSIHGGPGGMTQHQAALKLQQANDDATRANVFYALGALMAAVGGTALGLEFFYWEF